jgi:hypothetical protein
MLNDSRYSQSCADQVFDTLSGGWLPADSLADLASAGGLITAAPSAVGLEGRLAAAALTPFNRLTCAQVRLLVGQQLGLEWLSRPVALFCAAHPRAQCDIFPGDLTVNALRAWRALVGFAPAETKQLVSGDFQWLSEQLQEEGDPLLREAVEGLRAARLMA